MRPQPHMDLIGHAIKDVDRVDGTMDERLVQIQNQPHGRRIFGFRRKRNGWTEGGNEIKVRQRFDKDVRIEFVFFQTTLGIFFLKGTFPLFIVLLLSMLVKLIFFIFREVFQFFFGRRGFAGGVTCCITTTGTFLDHSCLLVFLVCSRFHMNILVWMIRRCSSSRMMGMGMGMHAIFVSFFSI
jgi:hypothetical protein